MLRQKKEFKMISKRKALKESTEDAIDGHHLSNLYRQLCFDFH